MKHKLKYRFASAALLLSALVLSGCQSKSHEESLTPGEDSNPVTSAPTAGAQKNEGGQKNEGSNKPALTTFPTLSPTPVLDFEEGWKYQIVQKGYYNAAAEWSDEGELLSEPSYEPGTLVYYNDCDEYYDNFVASCNVYADAELLLDDEHAHSSDNSMKIGSRHQKTFGLSGFALKFNSDNVLDISKLQGKKITVGFWVYYTDSFQTGVPDELTFGVWSNLNPAEDAENQLRTPDAVLTETTDEMTKEEKAAINQENDRLKAYVYNCHLEEDNATKKGLYEKVNVQIPLDTWRYVELTTTVNTESTDPMIMVATLGEINAKNVTYYNPFFIDDIYVKVVE